MLQGTNGGVTVLGLLASVLGGLFMGTVSYVVGMVSPSIFTKAVLFEAAAAQWQLIPLGAHDQTWICALAWVLHFVCVILETIPDTAACWLKGIQKQSECSQAAALALCSLSLTEGIAWLYVDTSTNAQHIRLD
jgi:hypothetical protein